MGGIATNPTFKLSATSDVQLPAEWEKTIQALIQSKGIVLLIGGADTGKTTLALRLASEGVARGIKTAIVDADIGQSIIGPPTTIGLSIINRHSLLNDRLLVNKRLTPEELTVAQLYFVGDTSPLGHLLQSVVGTKRMVSLALEKGAELVIVDTSGLISGVAGLSLKYHKVQAINPEFMVVLERSRELNQITSAIRWYARPALCNLFVPPEVKRIPPELRARARKNRFQHYFAHSQLLTLEPKKLSFYPPIENIVRKIEFLGLIVGLKDKNGDVLGIGIINALYPKENLIEILAPIVEANKIKGVELGFLRINKEGNELGRIHLWKFI